MQPRNFSQLTDVKMLTIISSRSFFLSAFNSRKDKNVILSLEITLCENYSYPNGITVFRTRLMNGGQIEFKC